MQLIWEVTDNMTFIDFFMCIKTVLIQISYLLIRIYTIFKNLYTI